MLRVIDLRTTDSTDLTSRLPRAQVDVGAALDQVSPLIADVQRRGAAALVEQVRRFDGIDNVQLRVPPAELERAAANLPAAVRRALMMAIDHARIGHRAQLPTERSVEVVPGGRITQRWIPVRRVGLYAPGGLAVYPSSVVMNAVAAQVAGVGNIALASPAQADFGGLPHPTVLGACHLLGIEEVYAVGGAGAIAMFAYGAKNSDGSELCAPVDVVTGPGNVYVAAAKRAVASVCGIDAEAGTTEIAVIADQHANPDYVAADLLSQAEHDPAAASVLITDSDDFAAAVDRALSAQVARTTHRERVTTALTGPQSGTVLVGDMHQAIAVANAYAAEHLEIHTEDASEVAAQIYNAGAIFLGPYTPVPLGDYVGGSNHVLPTGGTATHAAGLNVMTYLKGVQQVEYDADALAAVVTELADLARAEDLPAHAEAALLRTGGDARDNSN
ncbi:MAG: histidinol dehydrogenase [Bowdeniella nasicola]|nr:histidinol dehydrogenase [Bowdeniella nasicola]